MNPNKQQNHGTARKLEVVSHHPALCEVISAKTEVLSENHPIHHPKNMVKVPVVLAETKIQIDVESHIRLPEPAFEIKRINKKVYITQCRFPPRSNKLFLSGFVRKNIEYATFDCEGQDCVTGLIKHVTVDVPFECVTKIDFTQQPEILPTSTHEFEFLEDSHRHFESRETNLILNKHLNEPIFCELVHVKINEVDLEKRNVKLTSLGEHTFCEICEKMEINLILKILQNQQRRLGKRHTKHDKHHKRDRD